MTSFWKIGISLAGIAAISGASVIWWVHKGKSIEWKKLSDAATETRARAEQGDVIAEFKLALMYYDGKGVSQDYAEAIRWYRKAAEKGYAKAQFNLGDMYYRGKGAPQDNAEAVRWIQKAADQGDPRAQDGLGYMYFNGVGLRQDYAEAVRWYHKAAEQGDATAQSALGYMYYNGRGVPRDYTEARSWYRKAANQGDTEAQRALASLGTAPSGLMKIRYVQLLGAFLGGLWLSLDFLLPGRSLRDWRQAAISFLGLVLLSYVGLSVYGIAFAWAKGLLVGTAIVIVVFVVREFRVCSGSRSSDATIGECKIVNCTDRFWELKRPGSWNEWN